MSDEDRIITIGPEDSAIILKVEDETVMIEGPIIETEASDQTFLCLQYLLYALTRLDWRDEFLDVCEEEADQEAGQKADPSIH